ncbi:alpha/beta fold hydrolase [Thermus thermamylovorans]|uniref:Alpha/beta hydrolase n=1 Tax=Thermus thermamylovorans TaxID=2509362 RepID=A0A4Q9B561_9DEIN|nr:alpha/beta hydrolase [Thermus thermamylovorans]TBH20724.1 alpha/beta hydrolase [Thermus thermamylovorans]
MRRTGYLHLYGLNLVFDRVGKGPAVVLLAEEAALWPSELPQGYAFYLLDLPGHGRTGGPPLTPEELAEYTAGFLTMLNLGSPPILVRGVGEAVGKVLAERGFRVFPGDSLTAALLRAFGSARMAPGGEL